MSGFIWGKRKTAVWEIAPQIALRNGPKEVWSGEVSIIVILVKGEYMQSSMRARAHTHTHTHIYIFSCRNFLLVSWGLLLVMRNSHRHKRSYCFSRHDEIQESGSQNQLLEISSHLKICPISLSQNTDASCLLSTLSPFQGLLKVSSWSNTWLNPCRGGWQMPTASADAWLTLWLSMSVSELIHCKWKSIYHMSCAVLSRSIASDSLRPHRL